MTEDGRGSRTAAQASGQSEFTVCHVGRSGEVAGGMTQVVNSYLAGRFESAVLRLITSRGARGRVRSYALFLRAVLSIATLRNDNRTVVVVHLSQGGSFVREGSLLRIASRRGFGTVAQLHGSSFRAFSERRPSVVRKTLSRAGAVHALSVETEAAVRALLPQARVVLLPNAVEPGHPAAKERVVVFGGAVTRRKGVDVLLRAWSGLTSEGWRLVLAGPVLEPDLVAAVPPGVEVLGAVPHDRLMELLDRSSVAVLPSRDEAMPMFLLEAMARRNCVISTRVGGIPALLQDGVGMLTEAGDVDALAGALATATGEPDVRERFASAAHAVFESRYSTTAVFPALEALWRSTLRP